MPRDAGVAGSSSQNEVVVCKAESVILRRVEGPSRRIGPKAKTFGLAVLFIPRTGQLALTGYTVVRASAARNKPLNGFEQLLSRERFAEKARHTGFGAGLLVRDEAMCSER